MRLTLSSIVLWQLVLPFCALVTGTPVEKRGLRSRQLPKNPTGVHTIKTPNNYTIRYKEPGKAGVCETTPGVNSYSGYIDVSPTSHTFFWFFEARHNPQEAPVTLWLNGGPGSDSLIGLFAELGPCNITENLESKLNPYSWTEFSNILFLSQPLGVGFSYSSETIGAIDDYFGALLNATKKFNNTEGRYPFVDADKIDTTALAAVATWEIIQGFYDGLGQLDRNIKSSKFNLFTESYGGHYGPSFFNYFQSQNKLIKSGKQKGKPLVFESLGIGNGLIDYKIQAPYYPEFAVNNTYGIKAYNDTVYTYAKFSFNFLCGELIDECTYGRTETFQSGLLNQNSACAQADAFCRGGVEFPYQFYSDRGVYDIRAPSDDPNQNFIFPEYLNQASVQNAIGVNLNYTLFSNSEVYYAFQSTGDGVYQDFITDLGHIIDSGVRVVLYYGDADYICNWFGGEAASLQVKHKTASNFKKAGYEPFKVKGVEYGEFGYGGLLT